VTKVEVRGETGGRPAPPSHAVVRKLPVSRKATNPRLTRVESLVLAVLLGVLSLIVFVGVSGATRSGSSAACSANATAVTSSLAALKAENFGGLPTTSADWERALLDRGMFVGSPFLTAWPKSMDYAITVAGTGAARDTGDGVTPRNGDVLVTVLANGLVYDASTHLSAACAAS
jgi:hypothetical protein